MTTQTADPLAPLTGAGITTEDITASADAHRQAEEDAAGRAERDRAEAEELLARARAEADRIIGEAEAAASPLSAAAAIAGKEAAELAERVQGLGRAAAATVNAVAAEARVTALEDEREDLSGKHAALAGRLAELAAEARELAPQLAAALEAGALDEMSSLRNRMDSIRDVEGALRAQQAPILGRLAAIGDGELSPIWPQKELYQARQDASHAQRSARDALNMAFPDRAEAVADRLVAERREAERYRFEFRDAEAARQRAMEPRTFVRL
jgi:hypothetical protein